MNLRQINFRGIDYVLVGDTDGAIATKEQYENGMESYAHLYPNGEINRHGEIIGKVDDIIFGDERELEPTTKAMENVSSWTFTDENELLL